MPTTEEMQFKVPERALLPAACPLCEYSLKELPEPRCPECGTRVPKGTLVIVGAVASGHSRKSMTNTRAMDFLIFALVTAAMAVIGGLARGHWPEMCLVAGIAILFVGGLTFLNWANDSSIGRPPGVLQLSEQGFRRGFGKGAGPLWRWKPKYRWEAICSGAGARLRCVEYLGPFSLSILFDLHVPMTEVQVAGLAELWSGRRARFKIRRA